jgi:cytokinin riboside 5'-monophosphate phosphoribohydrolase
MNTSVCVYCSSSDRIARGFFTLAEKLGQELAQRDLTLVYGGGGVGLMGEIARSVARNGGTVVGVIPDFMRAKELAFEQADELIVTQTMRERKAAMEERAHAFFVLPGGFGTLEEVIEMITLKQLGMHQKPIVFINHDGFFDPLVSFFERIFEHDFTRPVYRALYEVVPDLESAFAYLATYKADSSENLWHVTT